MRFSELLDTCLNRRAGLAYNRNFKIIVSFNTSDKEIVLDCDYFINKDYVYRLFYLNVCYWSFGSKDDLFVMLENYND